MTSGATGHRIAMATGRGEAWGWTWVDNAPWGFRAVALRALGARLESRWGWIPGPRNVRAIYAPALVAFVGGHHAGASSLSFGDRAPVAGFPLGPRGDAELPRKAATTSPASTSATR